LAAVKKYRSKNRNCTGKGNAGTGRLSKKWNCPAQLSFLVMTRLHHGTPTLIFIVKLTTPHNDGYHGDPSNYVMDIDKEIAERHMALVSCTL
jgi:hypothetical protein